MAVRKKRAGNRKPSGDLIQDIAPAKLSRIVRAAKIKAVDPNLGTWVGWLRLRGILTNLQMAAALRWAALVGQYDRVQGMPRRSAKSPSYELGFGGNGQDNRPEDVEFVKAVKLEYCGAIKAMHDIDYRIAPLVTEVCLDNRSPAYWEHKQLLAGLNLLALYFAIKV